MRLLRPQDRIVFTFAGDADLPIEQRPKLIGKVLSVADAQRLRSAFTGGGDQLASAVDAVMIGLTGWENVNHPETREPIAYSRESLMEWVTIEELTEIMEFLTGRLTTDERKKSG